MHRRLPTENLDARRRGVSLALSRAEDGLQVVEGGGPAEGATFLAVGQWLGNRAAVGRPRAVEEIDWAVGVDECPHTLIVTVS